MNKFLEHTNIIAVLKNKNMVLSHHSSLSYINIVVQIEYDELSRFFHANQKTKREHGNASLLIIIISTALKSEQNPITTLLVDKLTLVNSFIYLFIFKISDMG